MHAGRWFVAAVVVSALAVAVYARSAGGPEGRIVWRADAEQPAANEWASSRADPPGPAPCPYSAPPDMTTPRIKRTAAVRAQGRYSYAITTAHGDRCDGERAELGQGNPSRDGFANRLFQAGEDRYISFQLRLGSNFDTSVDTWRVVAQLHQEGGELGTPPLSLNVRAGRFVLLKADANVDSGDTIPLWSAPATTGRWVRFTLHVRFSPDPKEGLVELWGNPAGGDVVELLPKTPTYTMKLDDSGHPSPLHARIGIYRDPKGAFGTETVYYDGFTVATSRAAAEANAFSAAR
jgi:hypothetical protein